MLPMLQAFFKVVFPDILPGILSGFLLAFTMSLDDFIITHFTKGPGIDTLSTKIYTEVKKGHQTGNVCTFRYYLCYRTGTSCTGKLYAEIQTAKQVIVTGGED